MFILTSFFESHSKKSYQLVIINLLGQANTRPFHFVLDCFMIFFI